MSPLPPCPILSELPGYKPEFKGVVELKVCKSGSTIRIEFDEVDAKTSTTPLPELFEQLSRCLMERKLITGLVFFDDSNKIGVIPQVDYEWDKNPNSFPESDGESKRVKLARKTQAIDFHTLFSCVRHEDATDWEDYGVGLQELFCIQEINDAFRERFPFPIVVMALPCLDISEHDYVVSDLQDHQGPRSKVNLVYHHTE